MFKQNSVNIIYKLLTVYSKNIQYLIVLYF